MMETKLDHHLGFEPYESFSESNVRNGNKKEGMKQIW
jgi:hypothetical protein